MESTAIPSVCQWMGNPESPRSKETAKRKAPPPTVAGRAEGRAYPIPRRIMLTAA